MLIIYKIFERISKKLMPCHFYVIIYEDALLLAEV